MRAVFLDIETTGLDPRKHRAIDIALAIVDVNQSRILRTYQSVIQQGEGVWEGRDPNSIEINGFTPEALARGKPPEVVGKEIIALLTEFGVERGRAVFICQNPSFDRGFFSQLIDVYIQEGLKWPYHWLDLASMYWTMLLQKAKDGKSSFPEMLSLSKNDIAKAYQLPAEEMPHRAMNGVSHLMKCYEAVLGVEISPEETA